MKLRLAAVILLLAVGAGAVGYTFLGIGAAPSSNSQYLTAQVARQDVVDQIVATGSVSATASYTLAFGSAPAEQAGSTGASTSGTSSSASSAGSSTSATWIADKVSVAVGDRVTKDQVLATATSPDFDGQILNADRTVLSTKLQLAMAQSNLAAASTTAQVRQATISVYQAQTQVATAETQLADLKATRSRSTLTTPVAGLVTSVAIVPGATVPAGASIVIQSASLAVVANVIESDLNSVVLAQTATVTVSAVGVDVQGTVSAVAPNAASSGGGSVVTFAVTVALTAPPDTVHAGMSAQVSIQVATAANVLAVPVAALGGTAGAYEVRILAAGGQVQTLPVSVGLITSSLAEIKSGLTAGQTVITGTSTQRTTTTTGPGGGLGGGGLRGAGG
jgi:macrolide-specific efflux system membrane fusion protein